MNKFQNIEAERSLLGCLLVDDKIMARIGAKIKAGDFYRDIHNTIYQAMLNVKSIDIVTVSDELEKTNKLDSIGGSSYLASLVASTASFIQVEHYADIVHANAQKRWLWELMERKKEELIKKSPKEFINELSLSLISKNEGVEDEDGSIKKAVMEYEEYQIKNRELFLSGKQFLGIESGFEEIDHATSGMQAPLVYLYNAYTGVGKSWLALNITEKVISQQKRVVFFSLEMGKNAVIGRLLALKSGINSLASATGKYLGDEREVKAKADLYDSQLEIYRGKRYLDEILFAMMAEHTKRPVDLFVIDYIQHIKIKNAKSRYDTYTDSSNELQSMAVRLNVPIVELSQIDNASARTKETKIIGAKGSGDIPADAQLVVLMQDDDERTQCYKDKFKAVNFIIQKNTYGEKTGKIEMILDKRTGRFYEAKRYPELSQGL